MAMLDVRTYQRCHSISVTYGDAMISRAAVTRARGAIMDDVVSWRDYLHASNAAAVRAPPFVV